MSAMTAETSNAAINANIDKIKGHVESFKTTVQETILQIILHAGPGGVGNGDCTAAGRLVTACDNVTRRNEIINHFADYSPIRVTVDAKKSTARTRVYKASFFKAESDEMVARMERMGNDLWDYEGCKANPWFERVALHKEPAANLDFNALYDQAVSLADRLLRMAKETVKVKDENGEEKLVPKVGKHDQERVKFLANSIRAAALKAKLAEEKHDEVSTFVAPDTNLNTEEPASGRSEAA